MTDLSLRQQSILKQIQKGFIADCLLGNWDITVGFKNMMVAQGKEDKEIKVYRFDNGGALRYRAMGGLKSSQDLDVVGEISTMRDPEKNKDGAVLFKFITDQDIQAQINQVLVRRDELWQAYADLQQEINGDEKDERELKSLLVKRLGSLAAYSLGTLFPNSIDANPRYTISNADGIATENSAAGMLNYTGHNGEFYVLLGKRRDHNYWGNLGGGSETGKEQTLLETAAREVREESLGIFDVYPADLRKYPSHDLVSKSKESDLRRRFANEETVKLFRMYLVPGAYVETAELMDKLKAAQDEAKEEYTDFMWVNLKDLMDKVVQANLVKGAEGNSIKLEGVKALGGDKDFELHWPLYCMLRQGPVIQHVSGILSKEKPIQAAHTAGSIRLSNRIDMVAKETIVKPVSSELKEHWPDNPYQVEDQLVSQVVHKGAMIAEIKNRGKKLAAEFEPPQIVENQAFIAPLPPKTATQAMLESFLSKSTIVNRPVVKVRFGSLC